MERLALALLAGTVAGLWLRVPPAVLLTAALSLTALSLMRRQWLPALSGLLAAWCWAALHAHAYQASLPDIEWPTADRLLSGCVVSFPRLGDNGSSFLFNTRQTDAGSGLLYLRIYPSREPSAQPLRPRAGECYDLVVRLKPPHGQSNPLQFDRQRWFMANRIRASGYVRDSRLNRLRPDLGADQSLLYARAAIRQRIRAVIPDHPATPVIEGLAVGVRSAIDQSMWDVFRTTGTMHLMAISGLHVGLVAGAVWWLCRLACRKIAPPGRLRWPALAAGGAVAFGYALLAGWSPPTQRAALMFAALLAVTLHHRMPRPTGLLAASVPFVLVADPFVVLGAGFWMSYLAVALLLTMSGPQQRGLAGSGAANGCARLLVAGVALLRAQWRLALGLLVPNMLLFDAWPMLGPAINLLAVPVFSLLLLPLTLVSVALLWLLPAAGAMLLGGVADLLGLSLQLLQAVAAAEWSQADGFMRRLPLQLWFAAISLLALLPRPLRNMPLLVIVPLLCATAPLLPARPGFQVDVLDVGQGTAVLIRSQQRNLLVDTGPAWPGGDAGRTVLLPFLRAAGITKLDAVVVSHADSDHSGGLTSLLDHITVTSMLVPDPLTGSGAWRCRRGMHWRWDEMAVQILHPAAVAGWSENDASCVLRVSYRDSSVLLPGDIETVAEAVLTARVPALHSQLVIAPHHGSSTSSGSRLISAVKTDFVVYTTAFRNRWGFPRSEVVARWRAAGACGLNLPATGALHFVWREGAGLQLAAARKYHWTRPWAIRPESDDYCL